MAKTVGLSREEIFNMFVEARSVIAGPEAMSKLSNFPLMFESEELNEAMKLLESGLIALLEVIDQNNEAIAKNFKS